MNIGKPKDPNSKLFHLESLTFHNIREYFLKAINIKDGSDEQAAMENIQKSIEFKGANLWVLAFSIFIASIGLNVNSTAVIIGAMLISPLMGPILGIGLGVGTNDFESIIKSLKSFALAVVISIITSTFYFLISPLSEAQSELLARTQPTTYDVLIAFFGGLAGIVGNTRKDRVNTVIPGVAIATALMPPLCTAGYSLANWNITYFLGSFYLFFINSVFICLATYIVVRFMGFPQKHFLNPDKEKRVKQFILMFSIITILPSIVIGWFVIKESYFKSRALKFVNEQFDFENTKIIHSNFVFDKDLSSIELTLIGETIDSTVKYQLNKSLISYGLEDTKLVIYQDMDLSSKMKRLNQDLKTGIMEDLYKRNEEIIKNKDSKIQFLENRLISYERILTNGVDLAEELKIQYPEIRRISFGLNVVKDFNQNKIDTMPTVLARWDKYPSNSDQDKMYRWLKLRLHSDTVVVVNLR